MKARRVGTRVERRAERLALSHDSTRVLCNRRRFTALVRDALSDMSVSSGPDGTLSQRYLLGS
jgi:hypothetical protein